ncbi:MAG: N-acetylmuramoyl-L-alanine amidase family protein [Bdellovibrionota bacterium]
MPSGKIFTPLFGTFAILLSSFFVFSENKALAEIPPYIVVLDAGHGGMDTGTSSGTGKKRVREKDITLAIVLRTEKALKDPQYAKLLGRKIKVLLTRSRDKDVSLETRAELAKSKHADLFVSVHVNSDTTHTVQGLETYFLNNTDSESSSKLEQIENRTTKKYKNAKHDSLLLRSVAADAVVDASREAAKTIHASLADHLRSEDITFKDRGVKQAMLYVLLDTQVPAVLIEAFYLSHKQDLALLNQTENRQKIAEGIAKGILRFLALQ